MALQVVCHAEILVAKVQQLIRSEQDTNPVVSDSIQAEFEDKGKLLQLVDHLGELKFREFHSIHCSIMQLRSLPLILKKPLSLWYMVVIHVRDMYNYHIYRLF